jgi:hippurate hydrolase
MHACGHDGHMSALLGFAYRLSQKKEHYKNNILLIFQPAEEAPGAAKYIVESGLLNDYHVKAIYGIHLMPYIEEGDLYSKAGSLMAECGEIDIVIKGKGAHAGTPEQGHDAIIAASMLVAQFQTIHSRSISPFEDVVLNIGKINGGTARNAVAEEVKLEGTLRCYDEDVFMHVVNRMKEIAKGLEVAYGCDIDVTCDPMYPPLLNDETLFEKAKSFGVKQLKQSMMLAEDFAFYTKAVPSLFIYVGTKTKTMQSGLHTSTFNFNEEVLERAVDFYEYMLKESI